MTEDLKTVALRQVLLLLFFSQGLLKMIIKVLMIKDLMMKVILMQILSDFPKMQQIYRQQNDLRQTLPEF